MRKLLKKKSLVVLFVQNAILLLFIVLYVADLLSLESLLSVMLMILTGVTSIVYLHILINYVKGD